MAHESCEHVPNSLPGLSLFTTDALVSNIIIKYHKSTETFLKRFEVSDVSGSFAARMHGE